MIGFVPKRKGQLSKKIVGGLSAISAVSGSMKAITELKTTVPAFWNVALPALTATGKFTWRIILGSAFVYGICYVLTYLTRGAFLRYFGKSAVLAGSIFDCN